ncbi:hypothetical protein FisN_8Lh209 [Fistulifera solaris]|uniref:Uncharacterized protein n=1 Tax=Fistulifera solaris TaxID=1519565 RepID=A0A1Z5JNZ0_FISSO|nr:hypothetical protein FisN_8Lh209 [Fistulifera solaris]|eukprot:GAX15491.1 hypothetical protein FisN_8Lh209 [Fistulifera solaris]
MTFLRAVLFAKGTGADASSYQPNRDESQWWNRRDALVRCVAAFLFGPGGEAKELVLLFEDDWSRMHMTYEKNDARPTVPTEQTIVGLWKKAAQQKQQDESVREKGLSCRLYKQNTKHTAGATIPMHLESKRDVLEQLQATCSIEFLREKGLNSSSQVLLRKFNKQTLIEISKDWNSRYASVSQPTLEETLRPILKDLLQPISNSIQTVIAATLHESSHQELPCWNNQCQIATTDSPDKTQVCIFLGAVRDMTMEEKKCLQQTCQVVAIPQVTVRLGPVPEFTSKILSVMAYHHAHKMLWPALQTLLHFNNNQRNPLKRPIHAISNTTTLSNTHLHFVSIVSFPSTAVTIDLSSRDRSLWCLVRTVVACLWRSRLAGPHEVGHLRNTLTVWFTDNTYLTLPQNELVTVLAEKHQAAPTEFQILQAIQDQLENNKARTADADTMVNSILSASPPRFLLDINMAPESLCLTNLFYNFSHDDDDAVNDDCGGTAVVLLAMQSADENCREVKALFYEAAQIKKIPVSECSFREIECQDVEASTITMLQHFCYQGLFFPAIQRHLNAISLKKEKKSERKRRNQQRKRRKRIGSNDLIISQE